MRTFDVDVLQKRGKQHWAVQRMFGEQPNAIRQQSVLQREYTYNTFMQGRFAASANAEQSTNVFACGVRIRVPM